MQAVINISSEGTRLRPLSCTKCVGMMDICDCEIVTRLIYHLKEQGIDDIIVITDYMSEGVEEYLKNKTSKVSFIKAATVNAIGSSLEESFIYISKSIYTDFNLSEAISFHRRKKSVATVVASKGISGGIVSDKSGKVLRIEERRMWNSLFAKQGTGIYILNRECVKYMGAEGDDISTHALPALVREGKAVYTMALAGVCEAVDDFASYMRACFMHLDLLKKSKDKGIAVMDGAVVDKGALLESPCYIGPNAHIHKGAKIGAYSIIGEGSVVLEGASTKRCIVGKNCHVGTKATLRGCVLDERVRLGESVAIYEQAVIGSGTQLCDKVAVKPFVKIWPEKVIEKGTTVNENLMWGQRKRAKLFEKGKITGIINCDITPIFCAKLGSVAGDVFQGGEVGVATDGSPSGAMLRDAIVSGLVAKGCRVKDFGEQPLPITRRGTAFYMLSGSICINTSDFGGEEIAQISLLEKSGFDMSEKTRLKMEELFEKESFSYPEAKVIEECEYVFEYKMYYLKSIVGYEKKQKLSKKLLVSCRAPWGRRLIASAMADFDCPVSMYSPEVGDDLSNLGEFEKAVKKGGFDMGFALDSRCEKLTLVLPGGAVDDEVYTALTNLIIMKKYPGAKIYIPFTASSANDVLAEKYGCDIIRTKTTPIELMRHMSGEEKYLAEEFAFRFDAVASVVLLVEYLTHEGINAENLINEIPIVKMAKAVVELPEDGGEELLSKIVLDTDATDSPEGVKITFDKGWVVIVPDRENEVFNIVGESAKAEVAKELCDICVKKLIKAKKDTP